MAAMHDQAVEQDSRSAMVGAADGRSPRGLSELSGLRKCPETSVQFQVLCQLI